MCMIHGISALVPETKYRAWLGGESDAEYPPGVSL